MSDLADLFPGFETHWIDTRAGRIFARAGGAGPPLALVHGFPQTHVEWHKIAPALAARFRVVALDLRGYGFSDIPPSHKGEAYSKRAMAGDVIEVMEKLGFQRFAFVGHDRGARVGYRLALDHPHRLTRLAALDIVPTYAMWRDMDAKRAMRVYHWLFMAQPAPMPERLMAADARAWIDYTLASWTARRDLTCFDPRALDHYRGFFSDPARIAATCEDYRAGATIDRALDEADRAAGRTIDMPFLALWGDAGIPGEGLSPLDLWRELAPAAEGASVRSGHFLPEEAPEETAAALLKFLA